MLSWTLGTFHGVLTRQQVPRLEHIAVLVAGVLVTIYAGWVIQHVGASPGARAPGQRPALPGAGASGPTQEPRQPASLEPIRKAIATRSDLLVIGDASGDEVGEWVDLWAQELGRRRQVTVHFWDGADGAGFSSPPAIYGVGRPLSIWNLSSAGTRVDFAGSLSQVPVKPGVVLLNLGHGREGRTLERAVQRTRIAVSRRWGRVPTAWVLQNPTTVAPRAQEAAVGRLRSVAIEKRVPVIDVQAAFEDSPPLRALLTSGSFPNAAGSRVWADAVQAALKQPGG